MTYQLIPALLSIHTTTVVLELEPDQTKNRVEQYSQTPQSTFEVQMAPEE